MLQCVSLLSHLACMTQGYGSRPPGGGMIVKPGLSLQVGVIDEVQMVGDPSRGASFTRAVLGLPAKVLHVCGDPAALPLLRTMAMEAGECFSPFLPFPLQNPANLQQTCCSPAADIW